MAYNNGITFDSLGRTGGVEYVNVLSREGDPLEYELPIWDANWKYKRRYSPALAAVMDAWDGGDPFASAMEAAWAVATCGRAMGTTEPAGILDQHPSPLAEELLIEQLADGQDEDAGFMTAELASAIQAGRVDEDDLKFAARVLNRYIDLLHKAGQSY